MEQLFSTEQFNLTLQYLAFFSLVTFLLSLIAIPWIVGRLSVDCFIRVMELKKPTKITVLFLLSSVLRNICGIFLLGAGIAMLFLPGQGILTILIALLLLSFPGKSAMIKYLVNKPAIQKSLDWIRKKRGRPTFIWP